MNKAVFWLPILFFTVWADGLTIPSRRPQFQQVQGTDSGELLIRDLHVGELNFLHTTDTHGWLGSHLTQPNYDADWGDFVSFASRFRENRVGAESDLILVDTGDKHDGNGLSDATVPNGLESTKVFNEQDYDLLTLGNHELYTEENTILEYCSTASSKKFKDAYVSSNVEFVTNEGKLVPFGSKYRFFRTRNREFRILALSFMFNFQRTNTRAKVTPALESLNQDWFKEVIFKYPAENVDVLVVFGHMPITDPENREINQVHRRLREIYPETVIQYFGGHSHIRDFAVFDRQSTGLQSGRFSETVGFLSITDVKGNDPRFFRRYLDFNKNSFAYHSRVSQSNLATEKGSRISNHLSKLRENLSLNEVVGYVPNTYYMDTKPLRSKHNIYHLLTSKVLPRLKSQQTDNTKSRFIIINTGAIRYDLYKGNFTKDSEYIVSPFPNDWNYIEVPLSLAEGVADYLNEGPVLLRSMAPPSVFKRSRPGLCPFIHDPKRSKGYTTLDDYGCEGDDIPHNTEIYYDVPNVVQSVELKSGTEDTAHLVFYSFIQRDVVRALNALNRRTTVAKRHYSEKDCRQYGGHATKELLKEWIRDL
ncbi:LAQU0S22e00320g1_1 [Lachancea quebecensis]|uniref:LAQU0S22e00320g1_1 n=1 Tax=Lachancea quebecensis TaxID=1654605 RepID=A0A0P1KXM1_9SACH|nr:LAQU0S22e00320g1_1 [Lachancea quebecensis]